MEQNNEALINVNVAAAKLQEAVDNYSNAAKKYEEFLGTISRNKDVVQALKAEIDELKIKQANLINTGNGTAKELKSISHDIFVNKDLIDGYTVAKEKEGLLDSVHQLNLFGLNEELTKAKQAVDVASTNYVEEQYLSEGIELLRRVAVKRLRTTGLTYLQDLADTKVSTVVAGELAGLIMQAVNKNNKVDEIDEITNPTYLAAKRAKTHLINEKVAGSPLARQGLKEKLKNEGFSLDI